MAVAPQNGRSGTIPPQNLEAEESVLGAMLVAPAAVSSVLVEAHLRPHDFYRDSHRVIYEAILELNNRNDAIDALTVSAELEKRGDLQTAGGKAYVHQLAAVVPAAGNARHYAKIVKDESTLRRLLGVAHSIEARVADRLGEAHQLVEDSERLLFDVAHGESTGDFRSVGEIMDEEIDKLEQLSREGMAITGAPSGFRDLDDITGGFQNSNLIVLAARPSMGKSALVTNIAEHVALKSNRPVALFSLEMSVTELAQRFVASQARMPGDKLRKGGVAKNDWPKVLKACQALEKAPLWIDDSSDLDILELRAKARRLHAKEANQGRGGLGLVIVDYLQLMRADPSADSRVEQVGQMSRGLKILARELDVPVIAVSQLNRSPEQRPDKRPLLSDLRECVTGDTLVVLADGRRAPIRELVGTEPEVVAIDEHDRLTTARSDKVWRVGRRQVFEVRLASGRTLRATADHRIRCGSGWRRVRELSPAEHVAVSGSESQQRFLDIHGMFPPACETTASPVAVLDRPQIAMTGGDLFWDRVVTVAPAGTEDVYDLTVPGPACWLADGIVSHNSGQIEQDADLVMFIYRDEYYNPETTEKQGTAEIHIAKHRNGPAGTHVELSFLSRFPKFANIARTERPVVQPPGEGPPLEDAAPAEPEAQEWE